MAFLDFLKSLLVKVGSNMHARLLESEHAVLGRYGQPISAREGITVGMQRFETALTFRAGSGSALCFFISRQLVRLEILPPRGSLVSAAAIEEVKKRYSADWLDLSRTPGLPTGMLLFISGNKEVVIEIDRYLSMAFTLTQYFPMPGWLVPLDAAFASRKPTPEEIFTNVTEVQPPRFPRPENNRTTPGQGWISFEMIDLADVDSLLEVKHLRGPEAGMRDSIQAGQIKELWFQEIGREVYSTPEQLEQKIRAYMASMDQAPKAPGAAEETKALIVYVTVFFKSPLGPLSARGWYTQGTEATEVEQKAQCEHFRDGAVRHYRQALESLYVSNQGTGSHQEIAQGSTSTTEWMRPETRVESPPNIRVYHLIQLKDVQCFIDDSRLAQRDIKQIGIEVPRRQTRHILEEFSTNLGSGPELCIYTVVFWRNAGGELHTMICVTFGNQRETQLETCKQFRNNWINRFRNVQEFAGQSADASLAEHAKNPVSRDGLPLAIAGAKEMTIPGSGFRSFALMNTGEFRALIEELGNDVKDIIRALDNVRRGEVGSSVAKGSFDSDVFVLSGAFYKTWPGALAAAGVYVQGPASVLSLMESFSKSALNEIVERLRQLQIQESRNN